MDNAEILALPGLKEYFRQKDKEIRVKNYRKLTFLTRELAFALLFQSQTLKYVRGKYGITNTEFKVLSAGRMIHMKTKNGFKIIELEPYLKGVWRDKLYKSVYSLVKKGFLIEFGYKNRKSYYLSSKGTSCLSSYSVYFGNAYREFNQ